MLLSKTGRRKMSKHESQEGRINNSKSCEEAKSVARKSQRQFSISDLVRMSAAGNCYAEKQICLHFLNRYKTYFLKRGYALSAIEDAIQEAMISLINVLRRDGLDNPSAASSYFVNSVRYQLWQHNRNSAKHCEFNEQSGYLTDEPDCFERVMSQKQLEAVISAIENLSHERDKQILIRRFIESQSIEKICNDFALKRNHFYRVLYRARQRLSQLVAQVN